MKKISRYIYEKINIVICLCCMLVILPIQVAAAPVENQEISLTLRYPFDNVAVSFYKAADFSETGKYELKETFSELVHEITDLELLENAPEAMTAEKWRTLAFSLESCVRSKDIDADFVKITDQSGNIVCNDMEKGLYLLLSETIEEDSHIYSWSPVLVTVPNRDADGNWDYEVELDYTHKVSVDEKYDEYMVQKVWLGDEKVLEKRPDEIQVDLYMDDEKVPYATILLNNGNQWKHVWEELPAGHKWTVVEKNVPKEYKVSYTTEGCIFYIANQYEGAETPVEPSLPQTGQLWWPVPVLMMAGISFFIMGWIQRRAER